MKISGLLLSLSFPFFSASVSRAQDAADPPLSAADSAGKALRYYEALVKRPTGGYLFDRFYNAWLDSQTLDELEKFLTERANAAEATTGHRLILAFYLVRQNASAKALELFTKALEKDPGNAEAWYQKALAESRATNVEQALKDLEKSLAAKPTKETAREARQLQGRLLVRAGRNGDAAKVWQALLADYPDDEELQEDLVEIQLAEGLTEEALQTVQSLLEKTKDPYKRVQRRLRAGDIQSRLSNRDAAIAAYAECLADVGSDSWLEKEILSQIEQMYRKEDAVAELRQKYEDFIKLHPQRVALRRGLAKVQAELGETEAALKTWQELLPLAPGDRSLREAYVQMLAENKQIGEAVTQLQALIALEPDAELLLQLAELQWRADKKDDCLKSLRAYLAKADATTETAALRVASQMERYEFKDAALVLYAETAKKFATSETALLAHAAALHRADKKDEARAAWRVLAKDADGPRLGAIARGVAAREEHGLAEELLAARLKDFPGDPTFLQFYCETAIRAEKPEGAVAPSRALLNLAKDPVSLDSALANAVRVLDRAGKTKDTLAGLKKETATVQEKCLLAELLDKSGDLKAAEAVLREVAAADAVTGHAALVRVQSARGEFKNAAESQEALVKAPGGRKAVHLQRLVELYEKAGLTEKALGWIADWRQLAPGSVLVWIRESDLLAAAGKPADALRVMRQAAQQFPADEDIRLRLAEAFRTEGKFADAARIYTMLFEEAKETTNKVRYAGELAKTAEMSGSMSALLEEFEERRKGNRASILPLLALAEIHRASNNYEGRRQALMEANRVKQGDPELLLEIARIEESEGQYERALETLLEVKKLDKSGKADDRIVRVLFLSGRDQEALQMFFRNAGGEKMDPRAAEEMALDLTQMGLWEEAESILQKLTLLHPGDYRLGFLYANVLVELEKTEAASAEMLRLLESKNEMVLPKTGDAAQLQPSSIFYNYGVYNAGRLDPKLAAQLPPGLPEVLRFRSLTQQVQSLRENRRNNSYYGGRSQNPLPASLDSLRSAVLMRCLLLTEDQNPEQKSALWKEIAARAALPAELLGPDGVPLEKLDDAELEKRVAAADANPNLFALFIYSSRPKDPALAVRGWDTFKDTFPTLAWRSLGRLAGEEDEANLRPLREATERIKSWPGTPSPMEIQMFMGVSSGGMVPREIPPALLELGNAIAARSLEWRTALEIGGTDEHRQAAYGLGEFRAGFLERTDVKAWVAFMEEEVGRAPKEPASPVKLNLILPRVLVWPLAGSGDLRGQVPFLRLSGTGEEQQFSIRTGPNSSSGYGDYRQPEPDKERAERLKEALTLAKHPSLRIALRLTLDPADGAGAMEEIKAAPQPSLYHSALRASWERKNKRIEEAVKILQEAAALPALTEREKLMVDEFLLTFALESDQNSNRALTHDKVEPLTKAAKEAAARLGRAAVEKEDISRVSGMMGALGMTAESKQLLARVAAPQQKQTARSRMTSYFGSGNAQSQAAALLEKGRRDLALRIITRELKTLARSNSRNVDDYYVRQWTQLVSRFGLEPALQSTFQTAAGEQNAEKLRRSAYVLNALGNKAEAAALWEKVHAANPDDEAALMQVLRAALLSDMPKARKMIAALKLEQIGVAGQLLANIVSANDSNGNAIAVDQKAVLQLAIGIMERLKPEDYAKAYVGWVENAAMNFARTGRLSRNNSLPSLLTRPRPKEYNAQTGAAYEKEMNARQALFDRLIAAALKVPGSTREAASITAALRIADGAKEEDQVPLIREAMLRAVRGPHGGNIQNMSTTSYGGSTGEVVIPEPEAFMARHAFTTKNPKLLDELDKELQDIAEEVAKKNNPPSALESVARVFSGQRSSSGQPTTMSRYRTLYFGTDKEVLEMLKKMSWPGSSLPEVFIAMERRKMEPGLVPLVEAEMKRNRYSSEGRSSAMTKLLLKVKGQKEAGEWLGKVAEIHLGPEDKRAGTAGSGNSNVHYFLYNFNDRGDAEQQFFLTGQYWQHYGRFLSTTRNVTYGNEWKISGRDLFAKPDAKEALATLKVSPFLADVAAFNALPRYKERSLFESCGETLAKFDKKVKAEIIAALEPDAKQFGTALLLAYLKHDKPAAALLDVVAAHEEEFKKLPAEKGGDWVWLRTRITADVKADALSDRPRSLLEWLEKFTEVKGEPKQPGSGGALEQFLAAKSFADLTVQYHLLDTWLPATLGPALSASPEKTSEVFKKLRVLLATLAKAGGGGSYEYYIDRGVNGLLTKRIEELNKSTDPAVLKELGGLLDAWQAAEGYPLPFPMLGNTIIAYLSACGREKDKDGKLGMVSIEKISAALPEHLDERHAMPAVSLMESVLYNMKVHEKPELRAKLEAIIAAKPEAWPQRFLADALAMRMRPDPKGQAQEKEAKAAEAARAKAKKDGKSAEEIAALPDPAALRRAPRHEGIADRAKLPAYQERLMAFSEDRNVNANIRAGVMLHALQHDFSTEPVVLLAGLRTQAEMLRGGGLLHEGQLRDFISRITYWLVQPGVTAPADLKTTLREVAGSWRAAVRKPGGRAYNSSGAVAASLLDLAILVDDDETIAGVLSAVPEQLSAHWLARLLVAGKTEAATRIILNGKDSLLTDSYWSSSQSVLADPSQWLYSPALHGKIPTFIASLSSPHHRALAAALLANFPDAPGTPTRDERMAAAAKLLPAETGAGVSRDVTARTLALLAGNRVSRSGIGPQIAELVKDVTLTMLPDAQDRALAGRRRSLLEAHLSNSALAGNFDYVKKELSGLAQLETNNDYEAARMLGSVAGKLIGETNAALSEMSDEARAANRAMWAELLCGPEWYGSYANYAGSSYPDLISVGTRLFHVMMLYARDDKMADFRALYAKQNEDMHTRLLEAWRNLDLNDSYKNIASWTWPKQEAELWKVRSGLTVRLIQTKLGFPGFNRAGSTIWLRDRIKQKLLLKDELYAIADLFKQKGDTVTTLGGLPAIEFAELYRVDGNQEKCLEWLKAAAALRETKSVPTYFDNLHGEAIVLRRLGRPAEALTALQSADKTMMEHADFKGERRAFYERSLNELDTEVLLASGLEKAVAGLQERITTAPEKEKTWGQFAEMAEALAKRADEEKRWAEAADWHLLCSVALIRLEAMNKDRADSGRAALNAELASTALVQSGAPATPDFLLVTPRNAKWRYLDDGAIPPAGWHDANFDDSKWPEGAAPLGYGDPGMNTETKPGGDDATNHAITTIFRQSFTVKDPAALQNLELHYRVDDGCVIFLNGTEIHRYNLPEGKGIDHETRALKSVSAGDETRYHLLEKVDAALLKPGANFLAVEVHQDKPTSTDLAFDAFLRANVRPLEEVYAAYWQRPMSPAVGAFWQKLPESFRTTMQAPPAKP